MAASAEVGATAVLLLLFEFACREERYNDTLG
jgi:hypothetical protein